MSLGISSGLLNAGTTQVATGKSILSGVMVVSDSTNPATVTVYDNTVASGTVLAKLTATVTTGANSLALTTPIRADNGLCVVVSGTGTPQAVIVYGA
jgi:hypothetical protein